MHERHITQGTNRSLPRRGVFRATRMVSLLATMVCCPGFAAEQSESIHTAAQSAVARGQVERTRMLGFGVIKSAFSEMPGTGGILVGFDLGVGKRGKDTEAIYSIRPLYLIPEGETYYRERGLFIDKPGANKKVLKTRVTRTVRVRAVPGYAVGGITVRAGLGINAMAVTFQRIKGTALDPRDSYTSNWVGDRASGTEVTASSQGMPIVGVFGNEDDQQVLAIGLIAMKIVKTADPPPVSVEKPGKPSVIPTTAPKSTAATRPTATEKAVVSTKTDGTGASLDRPAPAPTPPGTNWLPFVIFGIVTVPFFVVLLVLATRRGREQIVPSVAPATNQAAQPTLETSSVQTGARPPLQGALALDATHYLETVQRRLQNDGFVCVRDAAIDGWTCSLLAQKVESGFESFLAAEIIFVFTRWARLDLPEFRAHTSHCLQLAQSMRASHSKSLIVFPVAVVDDPDDLAIEEAEWGEQRVFALRQGIAIPVLLDVRHGQLHYFQELALFGIGQWSRCRQMIANYLIP